MVSAVNEDTAFFIYIVIKFIGSMSIVGVNYGGSILNVGVRKEPTK